MTVFIRLSGPPTVEEQPRSSFRTFTYHEWELPDPSSKSIAKIREELATFAESRGANPLHTGRELLDKSDDGDEEEALLIRLVMKKPVNETTARWVNTIVENALKGESASSR